MPIRVRKYEERTREITYTLTPSSNAPEGEDWFSLVVEPVDKKRVRLLLYKGDWVDLESGEVAESDPMLLTDKSAREAFYKVVEDLFGNRGWLEMALTGLSRQHPKFVEKELKKLSKDRKGWVALKGSKPLTYSTPYGYQQQGESSGTFVSISNFTAKFLEDVKVIEGGGFTSRYFKVEARCEGEKTVFEIPAKQFDSFSWVSDELGSMALIEGAKKAVSKAIRLESRRSVRKISAFGFTGWQKIEDERWVFLHSKGAIIERGTVPFSGRVVLEGKLSRRTFPQGDLEEIQEAIRKSFSLWDLFPGEVSIPLMASVYRAALGGVNFSVFLVGATGTGKTSFADMAMRFFGKNLGPDDRTNFESTGNSIEREAYRLKDQIVVLDDYLGTPDHLKILRFIVRVAANESGRGRLSRTGELEGDRPPRGLLVITGEVQPPGRSLNARLLSLRFKDEPGWKDTAKYREAKKISRNGSLALAMGAFVEWLIPQYEETQASLSDLREDYGQQVAEMVNHARTPALFGDLMIGIQKWLTFATSVGAISKEERQAYTEKAESAVSAAILDQGPILGSSDPASLLRHLLKEAIYSGKAYVKDHPSAPGERREEGRHLGWKIPPKGLFLIPDALYEVATEMAIERGVTFPQTKESTHTLLLESGWLLSHDQNKKRKSVATRKTIEGKETTVLHLKTEFIS